MSIDIVSDDAIRSKVRIGCHEYVGLPKWSRYAVKIANSGPVAIVVKLWIYGAPQKKVITRFRDIFDRRSDEWRLAPQTYALHPPDGRHFVYDGLEADVVAEVYDLDGNLHNRHELRLRPPDVLDRLWREYMEAPTP